MSKKRFPQILCDACFIVTTSVALLPTFAQAQIIISEVMYDPPGSDDKQEWIELYNAGSDSVDVTKYTFSDGSSATKHGLNTPPKNGGIGTLTMPPGSYLIIADDAVTFIAAYPSVENVIDSTMSLPNPNAGVEKSIMLYDEQKNLIDVFTYTGGTQADNKGDSLQRTDNGIIPAAPTPGAANAQVADTAQDTPAEIVTTTPDSASASPTPQAPVSSYVPPPLPVLFADAGSDRIETVAADVSLSGRAYDRTQKELTSLVRYQWNFGDGATAEGKSVIHHWDFPGRYAVTLTVANGDDSAIDRIIVTAEPARLSFLVYDDGSVAIQNLANRDLNLSRWIIRNGSQSFTLPEATIALAHAPLRIGEKTLGFRSSVQTELAYPNGVRVLGAGESTEPPAATEAIAAPVPQPPPAAPSVARRAVSRPTLIPETEPEIPPATPIPTATTSQVAATGFAMPHATWLWGAVGVAGIGAATGVLARSRRLREWEIEEEGGTV